MTRALAAAIVAASISLPLTHVAAQTAFDEEFVTDDFVDDAYYYEEVLDELVPTSSYVAPCPDGTYHLLYYGEPVVDGLGNPVCVTQDTGGAPGEVIPGQPGQAGEASNSEGVVDPGGAGEIPY